MPSKVILVPDTEQKDNNISFKKKKKNLGI